MKKIIKWVLYLFKKECAHDFEWLNKDYMEGVGVCEADLKCKKCGLRGLYSYGNYMYEDEII